LNLAALGPPDSVYGSAFSSSKEFEASRRYGLVNANNNPGLGMFSKWLCIGTLAAMSNAACAGNWVFVGNSDTQSFYVDTTSVLRDGNNARVWADSTYNNATVLQGDTKATAYVLAHFSFDCAMRAGHLIAVTSYDMDRHAIHSHAFEQGHAVDFAPDTVGDEIMRVACFR
jgi:hypothetical protein